MANKKCNQCGHRINPVLAKDAELISATTYNEFEINPVFSYCEAKSSMISDHDSCDQWISWQEYEGKKTHEIIKVMNMLFLRNAKPAPANGQVTHNCYYVVTPPNPLKAQRLSDIRLASIYFVYDIICIHSFMAVILSKLTT